MAGAKGPGNIVVNHSNFDTSKGEGDAKVIDGGGNQSAPPLFVDAENRNYHEAAGSPTIDAGIAGELGPLDLDGNPRVLGPAPDIGAFETSNPAKVAAVAQLQSLKLSPSLVPRREIRRRRRQRQEEGEGAGRDDGHLLPLPGRQRRLHRRTAHHRPQCRKEVREADLGEQREEEVRSGQAAQRRLLRRGCSRAEHLQVHRAPRQQRAEARPLPPGRQRGWRRQARQFQDHRDRGESRWTSRSSPTKRRRWSTIAAASTASRRTPRS